MFNIQSLKILSENEVTESNEFNSYYKNLVAPGYFYMRHITGKGQVCAVIDSGCDTTHPLLKDRIIGGKNFTDEGNGEDDYSDLHGHGTHVAGLISSRSYGVFKGGIAHGADLLICKVLKSDGRGSIDAIVEAVNYAIDRNVNVINMSLGTTVDLGSMYDAVRRAYDAGIIVCCASGNAAGGDYGTVDELSYPGAYQEVIEVGSINEYKDPSYFSNSNNVVDCVCYGEKILSTFKDGMFALLDGTSQATPMVSGAVLLIREWFNKEFGRWPSKDEVYATLIKCTTTMRGYDRRQVGYGYIDLGKLFK